MPIIGGTAEQPVRPRWWCLCRCFMGQEEPLLTPSTPDSPGMALERVQAAASQDPQQKALRERMRKIHNSLGNFFFLLPPRNFGEYFRIEAPIGQGAYGTVFRATATEGLKTLQSEHLGQQMNRSDSSSSVWSCDEALPTEAIICLLRPGQQYAVKRIRRPSKGVAEEITLSFLTISAERHIEFVKSLSDPQKRGDHIVAILAVFLEVPHTIFQVMEVLEGPDLFDWVAGLTTTVAEREAALLAQQILVSVHYLHRKVGALHRDIKPENFGFVSPVVPKAPLPKLKLFDLGLAWVLKEPISDANEKVLLPLKCSGTKVYIAPETWEGQSGPASDVWGCGLVVYLLLCRDLPFGLLSPDCNPRQEIPTRSLAIPSELGLSEQAKSFLASLLEKAPERRATTRAALADSWLLHTAESSPSTVPQAQCASMPARSRGSQTSVFQNVLIASESLKRL
mmetsp:Transcript_4051/g.7823  ORF Transcript_4051/g.7823 Transcript_4051/m.7823 type:complete len:453 (+) Transcript_4051:44-1402(+)